MLNHSQALCQELEMCEWTRQSLKEISDLERGRREDGKQLSTRRGENGKSLPEKPSLCDFHHEKSADRFIAWKLRQPCRLLWHWKRGFLKPHRLWLLSSSLWREEQDALGSPPTGAFKRSGFLERDGCNRWSWLCLRDDDNTEDLKVAKRRMDSSGEELCLLMGCQIHNLSWNKPCPGLLNLVWSNREALLRRNANIHLYVFYLFTFN